MAVTTPVTFIPEVTFPVTVNEVAVTTPLILPAIALTAIVEVLEIPELVICVKRSSAIMVF